MQIFTSYSVLGVINTMGVNLGMQVVNLHTQDVGYAGAALGRVPRVPVNPWISITSFSEPVDF